MKPSDREVGDLFAETHITQVPHWSRRTQLPVPHFWSREDMDGR
jgi:hypothetical protein